MSQAVHLPAAIALSRGSCIPVDSSARLTDAHLRHDAEQAQLSL